MAAFALSQAEGVGPKQNFSEARSMAVAVLRHIPEFQTRNSRLLSQASAQDRESKTSLLRPVEIRLHRFVIWIVLWYGNFDTNDVIDVIGQSLPCPSLSLVMRVAVALFGQIRRHMKSQHVCHPAI